MMANRAKRNASRETTRLRILAVENHADTREFLTALLESLGHTVIVVGSMGAALTVAERADCDVLLSDIDLPDGDGWELLSHLKLPRPMYAIAMSGYGTISDRNRSKAAGFRHHLVKPIGLEQLEGILQAVAAERGQSKQAATAAQVP